MGQRKVPLWSSSKWGPPPSLRKSSLEIAISGKDLNSSNPSHVLDGFDLVQNWISICLVLVLKFPLLLV